MTSITCFDGANCIGGNKILLEDGATRLFFDFGKNFGAEGRFYEEYLQPKPCTGLYEHLMMGLLPPLRDLYREDLCWSGCDPWERCRWQEIGEVGGILVTHAHVDHMGGLHYVRTDIPVFTSPVTAAVMHALQDTASSSKAEEYWLCVPREPDPERGLTKSSTALPRPYHLSRIPERDEFAALWATSPWKRRPAQTYGFGSAESCAGRRVRCFPVDHSVYGACAWAVETDAGWVVYTGDLRFHGGSARLSEKFREQAAALEPVALVVEGTRVDSERTTTESEVTDSCRAAVRECDSLVVADFGARNVERLLSFRAIALETGRKLAILPKDAYLLHFMQVAADDEQAVPAMDPSWARIYWEYSGERSAVWRDLVRDTYSHLVVRPGEVAENQDRFICCFSFWDINELACLAPGAGSLWLYSSCEAFSEEMKITADRLDAWLERFGVQRKGKLKPEEQESDPFHASGHASGPDLFELARTIRPRKLIPVHTLHPELYEQNVDGVCEVIIPERGKPIML